MAPRSHSRAAVVGAGGFIGTVLSASLERAGARVIRVTRSEPALTAAGALRDDLVGVSTIYWAASTINPLIASRRPDLVRADLSEFEAFCDAVHAERAGTRVVLLSSGGTVYGGARRPPHSESTEPEPTSEYGRAKLEMEVTLHEHAVESVVVRISNAYGPGQPAAPGQGVIGHWLRAVVEGRPVTVYGDLSTLRDYVYVDDVADALVRIHGAPVVPAVVNIGSGIPTSLADVAAAIETAAGSAVVIEQQPPRQFDIPASWLEVSLARESLGWSATTGLADGIARMLDWLTSGRSR